MRLTSFFKFYTLALLFLTACGSSSSGSSSSGTTVSLTGQVAVDDADANISLPPALKAATKKIKPHFVTLASTVLTSADVSLVKISPDGTELEVATATTDASGNYSLADVPIATGGTGASTDFYYEVRVTKDDLDVRAAVAPQDDVTVNVSPESNLAALIITDVVSVPGTNDKPTPDPDLFNLVNNLVVNNITDLTGEIILPSTATTSADETLATANGLAAAGGDAEKTYKSFQFQSEFLEVTTSTDATTDDQAGYIKRATREGCNQNTSINPLPILSAEVMAAALDAGTTFTPTEIVAAYNDNAGTDVVLADKVAAYADILTTIDAEEGSANISALIKAASVVNDESQIGLYTKRDLAGDTFSANTELEADQAVAFLESLSSTPCNFTGVDPNDVVADLTASTTMDTPQFSEIQIYNDSGFGCNGLGQGHFRADVSVYIPEGSAVAVNSVTIQSSNATSLDGDGLVTLNLDGGHYIMNTDAVCVTSGQEVTYTVTANLSDASTVTDTLTRTHPSVPEAETTLDGNAISGDQANPTVSTVARPTFSWTAPETALASIANPGENAVIKYTYEYSHMRKDATPLVGAGTESCPGVSSGALYGVSSFIPTVDCNVDACAALNSTTPDNIVCRMNIQTFLLDQYDNYLGQAAGDFTFFCVDTNEDGDCGA